MTVVPSIDPARFLEEHLSQASPDLLRQMLTTFINTLLSADAGTLVFAVCFNWILRRRWRRVSDSEPGEAGRADGTRASRQLPGVEASGLRPHPRTGRSQAVTVGSLTRAVPVDGSRARSRCLVIY